ncbi:MAG: catalase, partial [Amedibacillus dolichus]
MANIWGHLKTITKHKIAVTKLCFRCGLYKQGLLHDLSKYSWVEFSAGARYYQGNRSPIDREKEVKGYSLGWLHHKGRNKHHWEYWLDNAADGIQPLEMPLNYVIEMYCDRTAASKIYMKDAYHDGSAYEYFMRGYHHVLMHPNTKALLEHILI